MGSFFSHPPLVHHHNAVGIADGRHAVCNDQHRHVFHDTPKGILHHGFGCRIEGGSGLVQDQHLGVSVKRPGQSHPLALASTQLASSIPNF